MQNWKMVSMAQCAELDSLLDEILDELGYELGDSRRAVNSHPILSNISLAA